jgi:hypothetical protein
MNKEVKSDFTANTGSSSIAKKFITSTTQLCIQYNR